MNVTHRLAMYLSNPANALTIDPDNSKQFYEKVTLSDQSDYLENECDWVRLGDAEVRMTITLTQEEMLKGSLVACQQKLAQMDAEHQQKRLMMQEAISKLQSIGWNGRYD